MAAKSPISGSKALSDFVDKLREKMDKRGMSVRDLAKAAGVGYPYLYRVLNRKQEPTIGWMEKVGEKVGVSVKVTIR